MDALYTNLGFGHKQPRTPGSVSEDAVHDVIHHLQPRLVEVVRGTRLQHQAHVKRKIYVPPRVLEEYGSKTREELYARQRPVGSKRVDPYLYEGGSKTRPSPHMHSKIA